MTADVATERTVHYWRSKKLRNPVCGADPNESGTHRHPDVVTCPACRNTPIFRDSLSARHERQLISGDPRYLSKRTHFQRRGLTACNLDAQQVPFASRNLWQITCEDCKQALVFRHWWTASGAAASTGSREDLARQAFQAGRKGELFNPARMNVGDWSD